MPLAPSLSPDLESYPTLEVPSAKTFAASMTFDLGQAHSWEVSQISSDFAITLTNGRDGLEFVIALKQASAGGKLLTGVTASGRTVLMRGDLTQLNTSAFQVADAYSLLSGRFDTIAGVPVLILDLQTGLPLVVGTESLASRVNTLLGSLQVGTWDAALGTTIVSGGADAWIDQKGSLSLPAVSLGSGPVYSASDANFNGRPSITGATGKAFRKTGLSAYLANGSKPYLWAVVRMPALITDGAQHILIDFGSAGVSDDAKFWCNGTTVTSDIRFTEGGQNGINSAPGTAAMFLEGWVDSSNVLHLAINGVDVATASGSAAISHAIDAIGIFVAASTAGAQYSTFALTAFGVCSAAPSTQLRASMHELMQTLCGVA